MMPKAFQMSESAGVGFGDGQLREPCIKIPRATVRTGRDVEIWGGGALGGQSAGRQQPACMVIASPNSGNLGGDEP